MSDGASNKNKLPGRSSNVHSGNTRDCTEKDSASSLKATTEAPPGSLEFFVWNEEGINVCVDLNSSPSDWINKMRNEVQTSVNVNRKESGSLRQELIYLGESSTQGKNSFLSKTNSDQIDDHTRQIKSSSSLKLAKNVTGLDQQNKGGSPLIYDSLTPCSTTINVVNNVKENESAVSALAVNVPDNLKEYGLIVSAEISYGATNNYISGSESCAKALSKKIVDSDATDTPFFKSPCASVGNSPSDPDTLECQNSKPDNEISEDCAMLNGSCFVNLGAVYPGASLSGSVELQISEVASCHKYASVSLFEKDGVLDLSDPKHTLEAERVGLVNSSEELGKIVNGRESSECSQFDDPLKKSGLESDNHDSKMKFHRKRKHRDSEVHSSSDKPPAKNLRSMKNTAVTVQPRRSMRLISK